MSRKLDKELELRIVTATIEELLEAGAKITVNDGDEDVLVASTDKAAVLGAMFSTDEDYLFAVLPDTRPEPAPDGLRTGWVRFIYGNEPENVMSDYTSWLEPFLTRANAISEEYAG